MIYNRENDTFTVNNLAFAGSTPIRRGRAVGFMGGYAVYEADVRSPISLDGDPVGQLGPMRDPGVRRTSSATIAGEQVPRSYFAM